MTFVFSCPHNGNTFECDDFSLVDNRGVVTAPDGRKVLKAWVVLKAACPFCGERHQYRAEDLACPFGS